jgi:antibiotic biosynthesis monooxygenase (ABM) superfamily enzyme
MSTAPRRDPVTVVFNRRVSEGHDEEYQAVVERAAEISRTFPGHLASTVLHTDGTRDYQVIYTFSDPHALHGWMVSSERHALIQQLDDVSEVFEKVEPLTGLETWFLLPNRTTITPPPRWKMWLVSFVAVYPFVVLFQWLIAPELEDWPLLLRSAIFPLVLLSIMTFVLMPYATRIAKHWLYPDGG